MTGFNFTPGLEIADLAKRYKTSKQWIARGVFEAGLSLYIFQRVPAIDQDGKKIAPNQWWKIEPEDLKPWVYSSSDHTGQYAYFRNAVAEDGTVIKLARALPLAVFKRWLDQGDIARLHSWVIGFNRAVGPQSIPKAGGAEAGADKLLKEPTISKVKPEEPQKPEDSAPPKSKRVKNTAAGDKKRTHHMRRREASFNAAKKMITAAALNGAKYFDRQGNVVPSRLHDDLLKLVKSGKAIPGLDGEELLGRVTFIKYIGSRKAEFQRPISTLEFK